MESQKPFIDFTEDQPSAVKVIVWANQKGGVGKSTLCTLFANYLCAKGHAVLLVDCDSQQSIFNRREEDKANNPDAKFGYHVQTYDISDAKNVEKLMKKARKLNAIVIIDSPGSMSQDGMVHLFTQADVVMCPFFFDAVSSRTTSDFTNLMDLTCTTYNIKAPKRYYIPNRIQASWGSKKDIAMWEKTANYFATKGTVTPKVMSCSDLPRFNTKVNTAKQTEIIGPAFDFIYKELLSIGLAA